MPPGSDGSGPMTDDDADDVRDVDDDVDDRYDDQPARPTAYAPPPRLVPKPAPVRSDIPTLSDAERDAGRRGVAAARATLANRRPDDAKGNR